MTFPRFLVAGALNTGLTYVLYLGLLQILPYGWAYSVTYAFGIAIGYLLNAVWVFRKNPTLRTAASYPLTYVVGYLLGIGLLWLMVEKVGIPTQVAPLAVLAVTTPLMYLMAKRIFARTER